MIKKITLLTAVVSMAFAPSLWAQDDDMYFVPKKQTAEEKAKEAEAEAQKSRHYIGNTYYVGSNRNVDEYNRRRLKSSVTELKSDTAGVASDVIDFRAGDGRYPDSATIAKMDTVTNYSVYNPDVYDEDDYVYSRRIGRWYAYGDPWYCHRWYNDPWYWNYWGFYDPWVYSYCWGGYYDPYYWGWYDPWYDPWYYGGWYGPGYWGGGHYIGGHGGYGGRVYAGGVAGTQGHGEVRPHSYGYNASASRGAAGSAYRGGNSSGRNAVAHTTHAVSRGVSSVSRTDNAAVMHSSASSRSGNLSGYRGTRSYSNENYTQTRSYSSNSGNNYSSNSNYSSSSHSSGGGGFSGGGHSGGGGGGRSGGGFGGRR